MLRLLPLGGAGMLAGAIGLLLLPWRHAACRAGPHLTESCSGNRFCHPLVTRHESIACDRLSWLVARGRASGDHYGSGKV